MEKPLYKKPFDELCSRLNALWATYCSVHEQLCAWRKKLFTLAHPLQSDEMVLGYCLPVRDLTCGDQAGGEKRWLPAPRAFVVTKQELGPVISKFLVRSACWTVSQAYERFETFLLDTAALCLDIGAWTPDGSLDASCSTVRAQNKRKAGDAFVRQNKRNRDGYKERVLHEVPDCSAEPWFKGKDSRALPKLRSWLEFVACVRHASTHSDCRLQARQVEKSSCLPQLSQHQLNTLLEWFSCGPKDDKGDREVEMTKEDLDRALQMFVAYGYHVSKHFPRENGHERN
jgi:hypothetical protein